mgnify:CR=1 FL=1
MKKWLLFLMMTAWLTGCAAEDAVETVADEIVEPVAAEPKEGAESPYDPGRILGCHLYGPHASDIVQEACALISRKATLKEFEDIIHTHPTLTEVLQSAVHN